MAESKFEKDLEKLEGITEKLEDGSLSLENSLKSFEEGIKLARRCEKALTEAEKKIELLSKNAAGNLETESFEEGAEVDEPEEKTPRKKDEPEPGADDKEGMLPF